VLGITAKPEIARIFHWDGGMPQYTMGHRERVAALETALGGISGVAVAGNMFRGVGLPDCIASGESAADKVVGDLAGIEAFSAASAGHVPA
jgi:oxygen-dependent protoporphyrinogen oxidase